MFVLKVQLDSKAKKTTILQQLDLGKELISKGKIVGSRQNMCSVKLSKVIVSFLIGHGCDFSG